jgi:hypothetical protein
MRTGFWWGNHRKINNFDDLFLGKRIVLKRVFRIYDEVMDWNNLNMG